MASRTRLPKNITPPATGEEQWEVKTTARDYVVPLPTDAYLPVGWNRGLHGHIFERTGTRHQQKWEKLPATNAVTIQFLDNTAQTLGVAVKRDLTKDIDLWGIHIGSGTRSLGHIRLQYDPQIGPLFLLAAQCARLGTEVSFAAPIWQRCWKPLIAVVAERDATFDPELRRELQNSVDDYCAALLVEARRQGIMTADRQISQWLENPATVELSFEEFQKNTAAWERAHRHHFTRQKEI